MDRKCYGERLAETRKMTDSELKAGYSFRKRLGKEVGVMERVLAEREPTGDCNCPEDYEVVSVNWWKMVGAHPCELNG